MKILVYLLLQVFCAALFGQNLVPNGSFEEIDSMVDREMGIKVLHWYSPNIGTPDFLHPANNLFKGSINGAPSSYMGTYFAQHGTAYAGLVLIMPKTSLPMEHIQIRLTESLVKDQIYDVAFWVRPAYDFSDYFTSSIGALFSKDTILRWESGIRIADGTKIDYTDIITPDLKAHIVSPEGFYLTDTTWTCIKGTYLAKGGEEYMSIGVFWISDFALEKAYFHLKAKSYCPKCLNKMIKIFIKRVLVENPHKNIISSENKYLNAGFPYYLIDNVSVIAKSVE